MIDLTDNWALVTGASRGIGRACALRLADAGANVILNFVTSQGAAMHTAEEVVARGSQALVVKADVSEEDDVRSMLEFIGTQVGRLDILVSNAASGGFRPLLASTPRHFDAVMHTNVLPTIALVQAAMPLLQRSHGRAKVVAISSHGAQLALPYYGLIGSSKAALESLVRHLALELGPQGVNVNIVRAGLVETDSTRRLPGSDQMFAGRTERGLTGERVLEADDVANAVIWLASPLADLVQGATITVDGGTAIHV
jgi:enoyl-[acyl-carrier protein] reductase III